MSAVRKIVASGSAARVVSPGAAIVVAAAAIGGLTMITNVSGRTNADVLFAFRVTRWLLFYPAARFHLQVRSSAGAVIYEWSTGGGPSSPNGSTWLETAAGETVLMCKMPAIDAQAIGSIRGAYDLRVEDPDTHAYRVISTGIVNLVSGVTV